MTDARIEWEQVDGVSIRKAARSIGFDIEEIEGFSEPLSGTLVRKTRTQVIYQLTDYYYYKRATDLRNVRGVYVISLADNIFVDYGNKKISPVIYIGQGNVKTRLSTHFQGPLFDFSRTLNDVNFKIHIGQAIAAGRGRTYVDAEFKLIEYFENNFGHKPLLNCNRGQNTGRNYTWKTGWNKPLKNAGRVGSCRWTIKPYLGCRGEKWYKELT